MSADGPPTRRGTSGAQVAAILAGAVLALLGLALFAGGAALTIADLTQRDADGWFSARSQRLATPTAAITGEGLDLGDVHDSGAAWALDALSVRGRIRAVAPDGRRLFVGIARRRDLDRYLRGVAHDEVADVHGHRVEYRRRPGGRPVVAPDGRGLWAVSSAGPGTREVIWDAEPGRWGAVVMNQDGSPGVAADVTVGARVGSLLAIGLGLLGAGVLVLAGAGALMWSGLRRPRG